MAALVLQRPRAGRSAKIERPGGREKDFNQFRRGQGMAPGGAVKVSPVTVSKTFGFPSPKPWKPETFGTSVTGTPP